jgi:Tfp pilus assembly protein PilX
MRPLQSIRSRPVRQQGAATVLVMLALLAAMLLALLFVNRGLLLELRMSANQARATAAFEAAEAGLEWALAMLNEPSRIGNDCRAEPAAAASFRDRHLVVAAAPGGFAARLSTAGTPLRPACVRSDAGWSCSCPADTTATLSAPEGNDDVAAFAVEFQPGGHPGTVKVISTGCVDPATNCAPGSAASARIEASFALRPALATPPAAALTTRGDIATTAAIEALNPDAAANGLVLHAGGLIAAPQLRVTTAAGASAASSLAGLDAALATASSERLFVTYFGLAKPAWRDQPAARRLRCDAECGSALAGLVGAEAVSSMVWIDGDTRLEGPLTLGRPDRPVAIVVTGTLQLRGAVDVHGLLYAGNVVWDGAGAGLLQGALVSESSYAGDAAATFHRDAELLARLKHEAGSFVKVPGGWRDF